MTEPGSRSATVLALLSALLAGCALLADADEFPNAPAGGGAGGATASSSPSAGGAGAFETGGRGGTDAGGGGSGGAGPCAEPRLEVIPVAADTTLDKSAPRDLKGAEGLLELTSGNYPKVALLKFDLPRAAAARICSATLRLSTTPTVVVEMYRVFEVNESWEESQATWLHRLTATPWKTEGCGPPDCGPDVVAQFQALQAESDIFVPLPLDLMSDWLTNPATNHGLQIALEHQYVLAFYAKEYEIAEKRPALFIGWKP